MKKLLITLFLLFCAQAAHAQRELREIRSSETVTLRPDRAYLLFRVPKPSGSWPTEPLFMRIPSPAEMTRYDAARRAAYAQAEPRLLRDYQSRLQRRRSPSEPEPQRPSLENFDFTYPEIHNLNVIDLGRSFHGERPERIYLIEAVPGEYVFYGLSMGSGSISMCLCLGTVGFAAEPGAITDLGYILSDFVRGESAHPELRSESNFGPSSGDPSLIGATIRPVRADSTMPATLRALPVRAARYRAIGKFLEPRAYLINRLVPVPDILDYRDGRVVDVASGEVVPDNF